MQQKQEARPRITLFIFMATTWNEDDVLACLGDSIFPCYGLPKSTYITYLHHRTILMCVTYTLTSLRDSDQLPFINHQRRRGQRSGSRKPLVNINAGNR
jgi:hypothetical protein